MWQTHNTLSVTQRKTPTGLATACAQAVLSTISSLHSEKSFRCKTDKQGRCQVLVVRGPLLNLSFHMQMNCPNL